MAQHRMPGHLRQRGPESWMFKVDISRDPLTGARRTRYFTIRAKNKREAQKQACKIIATVSDQNHVDPTQMTVGALIQAWLRDYASPPTVERSTACTYRRYAMKLIKGLGHFQAAKLTPQNVNVFYTHFLRSGREDVSPAEAEFVFDAALCRIVANGPAFRHYRNGDPIYFSGTRFNDREFVVSRYEDDRCIAIVRTVPKSEGPVRAVVRPSGPSISSLQHIHVILSEVFTWGCDQGWLARNPIKLVGTPKGEGKQFRILTQSEIERLRQVVRNTKLRVIVEIAVGTGMRIGEILGLHWADVDLDRGILVVNWTADRAGDTVRLKPPKTKQSRRTLPLPQGLINELRQHRARQLEAVSHMGSWQYRDNDLVVSKNNGELLHGSSISTKFHEYALKIGVDVRFHDLRHTHISFLLNKYPAKVASERAGHASVAVTLAIYGHLMPGIQEDATTYIDEVFFPNPPPTGCKSVATGPSGLIERLQHR